MLAAILVLGLLVVGIILWIVGSQKKGPKGNRSIGWLISYVFGILITLIIGIPIVLGFGLGFYEGFSHGFYEKKMEAALQQQEASLPKNMPITEAKNLSPITNTASADQGMQYGTDYNPYAENNVTVTPNSNTPKK